MRGSCGSFYMARRKLEPHFTPEGKLPLSKWRAERGKLQKAYQEDYAKYKPIRDDLMKLYQVKSSVDTPAASRSRPTPSAGTGIWSGKGLLISRRGWYNGISFDGPPLLGHFVPKLGA